MPDNLISQSAFAKILKVSSTAVGKIKNQLTLVNVPGKKKPLIDLTGLKTIRYRQAREKDIETNPENYKYLDKKPKDPAPPKTQTAKPDTGNHDTNEDEDDPDISYDLKQEKIRLQNEKLQLEIDQKRGNLIEKALVADIFNKLGAVDENQFKTLNVTTCPKMSAIYVESYSDKTEEILKLLSKENDKQLRLSINKILNAGESGRIRDMTQVMEDDTSKILKNIQRIIDKDLTNREKK